MSINPTLVPRIALNDGTSIPQIGFGTWQVAPADAEPSVSEALTVGYRHIDTAAVYANEAEVGQAIASSDVPRDEIYVTTKLWNPDHGYDEAMRAFDLSMGKLGLEQLDLYLIHWQCVQFDKYVDTWRALVDLRASGRVRSIGVSNFKEPALRAIIDATGVVPVLNQVELHPWSPQASLRALHAELGIATESWSPLASGELLDDPLLATIADKYGSRPRRSSSAGTCSWASSSCPSRSPRAASPRTSTCSTSSWMRTTWLPSPLWRVADAPGRTRTSTSNSAGSPTSLAGEVTPVSFAPLVPSRVLVPVFPAAYGGNFLEWCPWRS